mgnify:CR=1 FL=1
MNCQAVKARQVRHRHWPGGAGRVVLLVLSLGLASCALTPKSAPVPVEDRDKRAAPQSPTPEPAVDGASAPATPAPAPAAQPLPPPPAAPDRPAGTAQIRPSAVVALLDRVDSVSPSGNHAQAAAELERALRISPRDGDLWLRLAHVRLRQQQWQQAESVALKCLSLPESDAPTKKAAWSLIGSAREARGDQAGSAAARQRAAAINVP